MTRIAPLDQVGNEVRGVAQGIERELRRVGTPERAAGEKRYLKSDLAFLGATLGDIRRVVRG